MPLMKIVLDQGGVNEVLLERGLVSGSVEPTHALLQLHATSSGKACVMLVVEVEGKPVVVKTTLALFELAAKAMRAAEDHHTAHCPDHAKQLIGKLPNDKDVH